MVRDTARRPHGHVPLKGSQVQTCQTQCKHLPPITLRPEGQAVLKAGKLLASQAPGGPTGWGPRGGGGVLAPRSRLCSACDSQLPGRGQAFIFPRLSFSTRRHGKRNSHLVSQGFNNIGIVKMPGPCLAQSKCSANVHFFPNIREWVSPPGWVFHHPRCPRYALVRVLTFLWGSRG